MITLRQGVLSAVLENPDIVSRESKTLETSSTEDFPSLPSQNSAEQDTLSSISSTDDSIVNSEETKMAQEDSKTEVIVNISGEQEQTKEIDGPDKRLENQEGIENQEDLKPHLNEETFQEKAVEFDSNNIEVFKSNLENGTDISEQHTREINNTQDDENLKRNHVNNDDILINENNTTMFKKNIGVNINSDQNNAEYISNDMRNFDSQDNNPMLCSKQVLPQQISDQDSERAIDCPS